MFIGLLAVGISMRLTIKNIGKIDEADIELNGITVIAGENNTGKSTVGKAFFCILNSFYKIKEQVASERLSYISNQIDTGRMDEKDSFKRLYLHEIYTVTKDEFEERFLKDWAS